MKISKKRQLLAVALFLGGTSTASAHFPWLGSDSKGHAVMWFGESTDDRTYPMPEAVQKIELHSTNAKTAGTAIEMKPVESDDLVGIQSPQPIPDGDEIAGSVTYGLYHGMKLTYHVEHLPQTEPKAWPSDPRTGAALQTVITSAKNGDIEVQLLRDGKPLPETEVKLFCEDGHEAGTETTNSNGRVSFSSEIIEPGLNSVMAGITDKNAKGELGGEEYSSTADYLTASFRISSDAAQPKKQSESPTVISDSNVSIEPSGLADLPEELTSFGAAFVNGTIYAYGGHTGSAHSYSTEEQSNRLWALDTTDADAKWETVATGPRLQGLALVAHGDRLVRIGGFTAVNDIGEEHDLQSQPAVASFDPKTKSWTDLPALPEGRSSLDAAVLGDTVYVFGGWSLNGESEDSTWHQTAWSLDLNNPDSKWQPVATPPFQRRAISVAAHDGKLFVVGGMRSEGGPTTRVDVYDPSSKTWSLGPALPGSGMAGFGSSAFAAGNRLYVTTLDGFVHRLAGDGEAWETVAQVEPARFFHRMLPTSDDRLVMLGGANMQEGKFSSIDAIQIGDLK
ncbi:kelch repeat-containing protein [Rhodopirellula bahusiensis]|uniref:kelch repeat-containing protein n=3 Tax=Rhodopirellula bahusiensis TaxID=2014065 RepID=UPI0032636C02